MEGANITDYVKVNGLTKFDPGYDAARKRRSRQRKPDVYKAARRRVYLKRAQYLEALKQQPCVVCGERYPPFIMEFHHLSDKTINVSSKYSISRLEVELRKCVVACANCHAFLDYLNSTS